MSDIDEKHFAMLIEAHLASQPCAQDRFLASLPQDMRDYCDETIRMRDEFVSCSQRMLVASNHPEAQGYAIRVGRLAKTVAYRWTQFNALVSRYAAHEVPSFRGVAHAKGDE